MPDKQRASSAETSSQNSKERAAAELVDDRSKALLVLMRTSQNLPLDWRSQRAFLGSGLVAAQMTPPTAYAH